MAVSVTTGDGVIPRNRKPVVRRLLISGAINTGRASQESIRISTRIGDSGLNRSLLCMARTNRSDRQDSQLDKFFHKRGPYFFREAISARTLQFRLAAP